ncbi:nucleolar protein 6 [Vanessa cardui]|uniref:nucleolar protein 6 n=1 Tax=Vanessa cardui TaxID=171605 RepID=UPI001F13121F|nr:nucleolar protein 6 [Vanessa cardui]
MVKRAMRNSAVSEGESNIINENGKRLNDLDNKDGVKRIKTKSLYRQPTANELNRLQETENLFNSNLFRLQIEEILQEVKVKEKTVNRIKEWFSDFQTHLLSIPEDETEYDLSEKSFAKQLNVKLPISKDHKKTKVMFKFHKFTDVEIVGSYALGCSINSKLIVDLQITVPAETYTKNDSINYKYHKKRAAYLAYIASYLTQTDIIEELKYSFLNGCETKPTIDIKPSGKLGNHLSMRLNLVCEAEAYKFHRFSPSRNNLRESWLYSTENQENVSEIGPPTPYYNSSVLCDLTASFNQDFLKEILMNSENLKQAVVLLKIWIKQRTLQVSGYVISMLIAYLVQSKRINNIMSSYQIVRNVWIALKSSEWDSKGISLNKDQNTPSIEEFHQHFPIVFVDKTGYYNICWQMSKGTYYALKRESSLAIDILDNGKINGFIPLFMTPETDLLQFDNILRFQNFPEVKESVLNRVPKQTRINYGLDHLALVTDTLYNLISKGLSNRVDLIQEIIEADFSWPVKTTLEKAKKEGYEEKLFFGFILNENSMDIVDRGPPANMPEAEEFRAFWGEKSELRRFQDGSITEACVWQEGPVLPQILDYLMLQKYGVPGAWLRHEGGELAPLDAEGEPEPRTRAVLAAFDELRAQLRDLSQLPLDVTAVHGISPVFSYCDPFPAHAGGGRGAYTPVNRAVLELSYSGKWPGDLEAFRCLKAAFHLQIAERLKKQYSLPTQAYDTHVDVLKNGLVFRLQIAHPKEITLLRRYVEGGVVKFKESAESVELERETVALPRLRGALHGLQQRHPGFGAAARLLRRWLGAHLLAPHFAPELCALLAASGALRSGCRAGAGRSALLRTLRLLADTDWSRDALLLDINDELSKEEMSELERRLQAQSPRPSMCVWAAGMDAGAGPPGPVLRRAQALARAALRHVRSGGDVLEVFVPSLRGYDALVRLRARGARGAGGQVKTAGEGLIPVVEFDPVRKYLDELRSAYDEFAVFFYDEYGGDVIAVLWKPDIHEPREFQTLNAHALKPVTINGETKYKVNIEAILEDFRILGEGLVIKVTQPTE